MRRFWVFYVLPVLLALADFGRWVVCQFRGHRWVSRGLIDIGGLRASMDGLQADAAYCSHCRMQVAQIGAPLIPPRRGGVRWVFRRLVSA